MDKKSPSTAQPNTSDAAASPELKAPNGWQKKLIHKNGPYGRTAVTFVSPDGDEIKSRRKLELYMKSHPGGPSLSEFCWSPDDTPRHSLRITESKADESPQTETSNKKQKKEDGVKEEDSDIEEQKTEVEMMVENFGNEVDIEVEVMMEDSGNVVDIEVEVMVEDSGDNRSSRLIKSSSAETPKTETLKKRQKKSSSKKGNKVKKTTEEKGAKEEPKGSAEVAMEAAAADIEQQVNRGQGLKAQAVAGGRELKDVEQKSDQVEDVKASDEADN